jgi:hypothetical protein
MREATSFVVSPERWRLCPAGLSPSMATRLLGAATGGGPVSPTQSLTPRDRQYNFDNQALYQAGDSAEWLRQHGKGLFPFFQ